MAAMDGPLCCKWSPCSKLEKQWLNDYKTMARCLGNRNDTMDEIDTSALQYLSLSAENY